MEHKRNQPTQKVHRVQIRRFATVFVLEPSRRANQTQKMFPIFHRNERINEANGESVQIQVPENGEEHLHFFTGHFGKALSLVPNDPQIEFGVKNGT